MKYKCSITLISLLEARSKEDDIVPRMMKTLNIDVIRRNITDIYNQYVEIGKKEYNNDLFNHFDLVYFEKLINIKFSLFYRNLKIQIAKNSRINAALL